MELEWLGDYRDIVEQLIKYCNMYAATYRKEDYIGTIMPVSYAQIQVVEYLLENESLHQNMIGVASRLGITPSSFSKLVNKLVGKGLLKKFYQEGNRKDVIVQVTDLGREQYASYSKYIYKMSFSQMFSVADQIPKEVLPLIADMLRASLEPFEQQAAKPEPRLIPLNTPQDPQAKNGP